jgi:hypothetical protein
MPLTFFGMLVSRFCLQVLLQFRLHRRIDDPLDRFWEYVKTLLGEPFRKFGREGKVLSVGQGVFPFSLVT